MFAQQIVDFENIKITYEGTLKKLNADLNIRIATYNTVLCNTFRKFNGSLDAAAYYAKHSIPADATFLRYAKYTNTFQFTSASFTKSLNISPTAWTREQAKDIITIQGCLLNNDPVAIAQFARKIVRAQQAENVRENLKTLATNVSSAEKQIIVAQKRLVLLEKQLTDANNQTENIINHVNNQAEQKRLKQTNILVKTK